MRECLKTVILHERYRIEEVLGYGGFAITYRATDLNSQTMVAIKEYFPKSGYERIPGTTSIFCTEDAALYEKSKERFYREAGMLKELDGIDEVVCIIDCFEENGTVYIVMEYVQGRTLSEYVREQGVFEWEVFHDILKKVVIALIRIHEQGFIHRDLSPENIMLLADGSVKLLDFGAVKEVGTEVEVGDALTNPTEAIVKKGFAPVEQYQNWGNLGPWTDVYGLCATIYFCLTGKLLPDALDRVLGVEEQEENEDWPNQSMKEGEDAAGGMPEHIRNAVERGTQTRIADRPRSMEELYGLLFCDEEPECRKGKQHIGRKLWVLMGVGTALTLGVIWFWTHCVYVTLREGQDIQKYLDRPYVLQVTVPDGVAAAPANLSVQKRIVIEDGGVLAPGELVMEEGGSIRVEGELVLEGSVVRVRREGCCAEIGESGVLRENVYTLYLLGGTGSFPHTEREEEPDLGSSVIIRTDEEALFADAVSVTSYEELQRWCNGSRAVSIDEDLDIPEQICLQVPVRISEGVTVNCRENQWFTVCREGMLLNKGVFRGGLQVIDGAEAVNYGTLETGVFHEWTGLWIERDAILVNEGTIRAYLGTSVWKGGIVYNLGEFIGYDLCLRGGCMLNMGSLQISGDRNGCVISRESVLWNRGKMQVLSGARVYNSSHIENTGEIFVEENAAFASILLVNEGVFEAGYGAELGEIPGVYFGNGEYRLTGTVGLQNIARCGEAARWEDGAGFTCGEKAAAVVSDQEQLSAALADERIAAVFTENAITVSEDLDVEKPLLLFGDLTVQDGAEVRLLGSGLLVMKEAEISNARLLLQSGHIVCSGTSLILRNSDVCIDGDSLFRTKNTDFYMEGTRIENNGAIRLEGWPEDAFSWRDSGISDAGTVQMWKQPDISDKE